MFSCLLSATRQSETFHIQPVVDLRSNRICGGELLWRPDGQPPSREAFEALDEDPVLNLQVGQEAFLFALRFLSRSQSHVWLSVNLSCHFIASSRAFFRPISKAVEDLDTLRRKAGKRLVIEVVEKGVAGPRERDFINELSQIHTIAVDDFGVGEAPLSHMLAFNYSKVKLDRSVVSNCDSDLYRQRHRTPPHPQNPQAGKVQGDEGGNPHPLEAQRIDPGCCMQRCLVGIDDRIAVSLDLESFHLSVSKGITR